MAKSRKGVVDLTYLITSFKINKEQLVNTQRKSYILELKREGDFRKCYNNREGSAIV